MSNFALFQLPVQAHCSAQGMLWRTSRGGEKVGGSWSPAWTERHGMHIHSHLSPKAACCFLHARRTIYRSASYRGGVLEGLTMSLKFILKITLLRRGFRREQLPLCAKMLVGKHGECWPVPQQGSLGQAKRAEVRLPPEPGAGTALSHAGAQAQHQQFQVLGRCRPQRFPSISSFCSCFLASLSFSLGWTAGTSLAPPRLSQQCLHWVRKWSSDRHSRTILPSTAAESCRAKGVKLTFWTCITCGFAGF